MIKPKQIYVAKHPHASIIKIGMSDNPYKRLASLSNTVGGKLELLYESKAIPNPNILEAHLHKHFREFRTGGEWFEIDGAIAIEYLKSIEDNYETAEYKDLLHGFEPECDCVTEYNHFSLIELTEVEQYIYRDSKHYYYIKYAQADITKGAKFCNLSIARAFKKQHFERLREVDLTQSAQKVYSFGN